MSLSTEAVASSMTRMLDFLRNARAKQKSCRWPMLKFSPPPTTGESARKRHNGLLSVTQEVVTTLLTEGPIDRSQFTQGTDRGKVLQTQSDSPKFSERVYFA